MPENKEQPILKTHLGRPSTNPNQRPMINTGGKIKKERKSLDPNTIVWVIAIVVIGGMITLIVSGGDEYGLNAGLPSIYIEQFCSKHINIIKGE